MYNNLDWLVHWYIDDYVELNSEQKSAFDRYMKNWLTWHRSQELVIYRDHLSELRQRIDKTPLTQQQWLNEFERARVHWFRLLDELDEDISDLSLKLTDDQLVSIFDELEQQNQKREKRRQNRDKNWRLDNLKEDVVRWTGPLSEPQEQMLKVYSGQLKENFEDWMQYRRKWQSEAKNVLMNRKNTDQWRQAMSSILLNPDQFRHPQYRQKSDHNRHIYATMLAELHASLSAQQKSHLHNEIGELIEDLNDLVDDT
ncbi:hypothetical protein GCM10011357_06380 [Lacimicrobium alkaliphilum]|uniref:Uncharacterized protein n=2 Tax=Lacimicrobium alkaliphilum TaxID=1526571 RepID=A0ABQ1R1R2_9ALTE|nr:hypothetical protein GCM10011357_06380 [Lacimicrobium alkaliphilum]